MTVFLRLLALLLILAAGPALAQEPELPGKPAPSRAEELDQLFGQLHEAGGADTARPLVHRIEQLWLQSGSDTVDLFMNWALAAAGAQNYGAALDFLDEAVLLAPDYAEAYNRRATVYYLMDEYGAAIADVQRTLTLEPRHFNALSGLGAMLEQLGRPQQAYEVYRRALELNPGMNQAEERVEALRGEAEGRPI